MMSTEQTTLPCPFCGKKIDPSDIDTVYPTGSGWKQHEGYRSYHYYLDVPKEQWCYGIHCVESSGGCGANISGDSKLEVLAKWNTRTTKGGCN
jgi:hypothetical protein